MEYRPPYPGARQAVSARILGIAEVTSRVTVIKCMGRTYTAAAADGTVHLHDRTDITSPRPFGSARPAAGSWEICDPRGNRLSHTQDLLEAVSLLRQAQWPPRDQVGSDAPTP
ncbi:hypothetical protein [Streptacidiphilus sp. EB129]|uniref:hypothetical protein n=1 Tax=Streptacidiphilus sp. EB129 TaxID=3156262 RepID=UPI0035143B9D